MKKKKIITVIWSLLVTLLLVAVGGYFYLMDMQRRNIKLTESNVHIILSNPGWTTSNIELKIKYDGDASADIKGYSFDGGKTWSKGNIITVDKNKTLNIAVKDINDKVYEVEYKIENFDTEGPIITVADNIQITKNSKVNLSDYVTVTDEKSGVDSEVTFNPSTLDTTKLGEQVLTAIAVDKVGNHSSVNFAVKVVEKAPEIPVNKIVISHESLEMSVNEENNLTVSFEPKYASNKAIAWTSSNPSVATVQLGKIKALAEGETVITAKTANGKTATCTITVK